MSVTRLQALQLSNDALVELIRAVLENGRSFRFQAKGFSMAPFIKDGDRIVLSPSSRQELSLGDAVAVLHPKTGRMVVHRIVGRRERGVLTKGDNNNDLDGVVEHINILGRVTEIQRRGKQIRFGFGPERRLLALLSNTGLLKSFIAPLRLIRRSTSK